MNEWINIDCNETFQINRAQTRAKHCRHEQEVNHKCSSFHWFVLLCICNYRAGCYNTFTTNHNSGDLALDDAHVACAVTHSDGQIQFAIPFKSRFLTFRIRFELSVIRFEISPSLISSVAMLHGSWWVVSVAATDLNQIFYLDSYVQLQQQILRPSLGFAKRHGRHFYVIFLRRFVEVSK